MPEFFLILNFISKYADQECFNLIDMLNEWGSSHTGLLLIITIIVAIVFGIIPVIQNRKKKRKEKVLAKASPTDHYKFIWKSAADLTPEDVLDTRGMKKYGFKKYYYRRKYHRELVKRIKAGDDAIVVGMSLSGKTRTVYEALKSLKGYSVTLLERFEPLESPDLAVPKIGWWHRKKKRILVIDDINNFIGKPGFDILFNNFMTAGVTVVATCRTGLDLAGYAGTELSTNFKKPIELKKLELEDVKKIVKEIKVKPPDGYDGNIGSIFIDLAAMKKRYSELNDDGKRVFNAVGILHYGGVFDEKGIFPIDRVRLLSEKKFALMTDDRGFRDILEILKKNELIDIERGTVDFLKVEEAYIDKIVEEEDFLKGKNPTPEDFAEMIQIFSNDPQALFAIGLRAYKIGLYDIRKRDYMRVSILANHGALKFWTEKNERYKYAMTKGNLGISYSNLSTIEATEKNIKEAIKSYEEALNVFTYKEFPIDYAQAQNNLGVSYDELAKIVDTAENLNRAIGAYEEALKVRTLEEFPIDYAMTQNNLGVSYYKLAKINDTAKNLKRAIEAYEEALKVRTLEEFPIQYAMTKLNLGSFYISLAEIGDKDKNHDRARRAYNEALEIFKKAGITQYIKGTEKNIEILNKICKEGEK